MKLDPEKSNKKYGGSDDRKDNCMCYHSDKGAMGEHSSAWLQPSPPTKMTDRMTQRGVGLGSATCCVIVANRRLI